MALDLAALVQSGLKAAPSAVKATVVLSRTTGETYNKLTDVKTGGSTSTVTLTDVPVLTPAANKLRSGERSVDSVRELIVDGKSMGTFTPTPGDTKATFNSQEWRVTEVAPINPTGVPSETAAWVLRVTR